GDALAVVAELRHQWHGAVDDDLRRSVVFAVGRAGDGGAFELEAIFARAHAIACKEHMQPAWFGADRRIDREVEGEGDRRRVVLLQFRSEAVAGLTDEEAPAVLVEVELEIGEVADDEGDRMQGSERLRVLHDKLARKVQVFSGEAAAGLAVLALSGASPDAQLHPAAIDLHRSAEWLQEIRQGYILASFDLLHRHGIISVHRKDRQALVLLSSDTQPPRTGEQDKADDREQSDPIDRRVHFHE